MLFQILNYPGFVRHICSTELWSGYQQCLRSEIRCRQEAWGIDRLLSASLQALHSGNHRDMPPLISTDQSSDNISSPWCLQTCLKCLHSGLYNEGSSIKAFFQGQNPKMYSKFTLKNCFYFIIPTCRLIQYKHFLDDTYCSIIQLYKPFVWHNTYGARKLTLSITY